MKTSKALETLFKMCKESNASDLHLAVGLPLRFRGKGALVAMGDLRVFDAADVDALDPTARSRIYRTERNYVGLRIALRYSLDNAGH